ncbi:MAG: energy-coupling factor transporter transmembrane component T [Candidatus Micrarchaeota archaeon]|nr:energy-coupling factor transporter transmembrane component T [Candidatus Micrarchaeota archaeon]
MIKYAHRESAIHALRPQAKLVFLVVSISLLVFFGREAAVSFGFLALSLVLYSVARISPARTISSNRAIFAVLLIPFLFNLLAFSPERAITNAAYLSSVILLSLLFVMTTKPSDFANALASFLVPRRIAFAFSSALNFIGYFERSIERTRVSQLSRAGSRNPLPLIVPVLHKAFRKAKTLSISMESRGFDPDRL